MKLINSKTWVLVIIAGMFNSVIAQNQKFRIKQHDFVIRKTFLQSEAYKNKMDTIISLYRIEEGKEKYLLKHALYSIAADCNNEFIYKGTFQIKNDSLVFEETTHQKGSDPIPVYRKQIYYVNDNGQLMIIYDRMRMSSGIVIDNIKK